jgi:hypothetical protein
MLALVAGSGGGSKAGPFGRFIVGGGHWVILVGGLTPPVPPAVGWVEACLPPIMMFGRKLAQFCVGPTTTAFEGVAPFLDVLL